MNILPPTQTFPDFLSKSKKKQTNIAKPTEVLTALLLTEKEDKDLCS